MREAKVLITDKGQQVLNTYLCAANRQLFVSKSSARRTSRLSIPSPALKSLRQCTPVSHIVKSRHNRMSARCPLLPPNRGHRGQLSSESSSTILRTNAAKKATEKTEPITSAVVAAEFPIVCPFQMSATAPATIVRGRQTTITAPRITTMFSRDTSCKNALRFSSSNRKIGRPKRKRFR